MTSTIVTGSFAADHQKPYGDARHGHDWHVEAALPAGGHKDQPQAVLDRLLARLDHQFLDHILADPSNEGVAAWLGDQLGAKWVQVWRYDRGRKFGAEWP